MAVSALVAASLFIFSSKFPIVNVLIFIIFSLLVIQALKNNQITELHWQANGVWLITRQNTQMKAILREGSVVTAFFAVLNFKLENSKLLNIVIFKDNIDAQDFRKLRVKLKVEGIKSQTHDRLL